MSALIIFVVLVAATICLFLSMSFLNPLHFALPVKESVTFSDQSLTNACGQAILFFPVVSVMAFVLESAVSQSIPDKASTIEIISAR